MGRKNKKKMKTIIIKSKIDIPISENTSAIVPSVTTKVEEEEEVEKVEDDMIYVGNLKPVPKMEHEISLDFDLLRRLMLFRTHSKSAMQNMFIEKLEERFTKRGGITKKDSYGNLYVVKGDAAIYPCVVAHTDINQSKADNPEIIMSGDWIFGMDMEDCTQCGMGADDKVGVYFACEMFDRFDNIKLFFPKDEEVGLIGTGLAEEDFFTNCSMLVQLDRRSYSNDLINSTNGIKVFGKEFENAASGLMEKYNYKINTGSCTDIGGLKKKDKVNCVAMNVSCGYLNEHSNKEVISVPHMINAINFGYELLQLGIDKVWEHKSEVVNYGGYGSYGGYGGYGAYYGYGSSKGKSSYSSYDEWYEDEYGPWDSAIKKTNSSIEKKDSQLTVPLKEADFTEEMAKHREEAQKEIELDIDNNPRDKDLPKRTMVENSTFRYEVETPMGKVTLTMADLETDNYAEAVYPELYSPMYRAEGLYHLLVDSKGVEEEVGSDYYWQEGIDKDIVDNTCPNCGDKHCLNKDNALLLNTYCVSCGSHFNLAY